MHGLTVYVKEGLPFALDLSLEISMESYFMFTHIIWMIIRKITSYCRKISDKKLTILEYFDALFVILSVLLLFSSIDHLLCLYERFLFLVYLTRMRVSQSSHQLMCLFLETLTSIIRTDRSGEHCCNFSISNNLTQVVNFPTWIPDCDSHSPALLDWFISSEAIIVSTTAFPVLGNSDHVVISVSIDFPSNSKWDAPFHRIAYPRAESDSFCDHFKDVSWEDIFKLGASAAYEFCEWVQFKIDVYIPQRKYQVKPHSSLWFSSACAASVVHKNHLFHLYQQ